MGENQLKRETSPYLLQHQDNPVHWWAWGAEALAEARASGKPILLSIGYAACHWCHVMAHESFEDEATAAVINALFVAIKVDREERPDIDAIYMSALQKLGEPGGWPLTMFLDPEAKPFWGGTYFPKDSRYGKPSFVNVLRQVAHIFANDRATVDHNAGVITGMLSERAPRAAGFVIDDARLEDIAARLLRLVDSEHGGLQGAPKFPQWSVFWLLWRAAIRYDHPFARAAVEKTLIQICQGGMYDHLGGGFARYSTDEKWLVPHFEKMLSDNALLIDLMCEVYRETGNPLFKVRVAETIAWLVREMLTAEGAFAASLDADTEGEEGKFYVWTFEELVEVLGGDVAKVFGRIYDVTPGGNFEGKNVLNRLNARELMGELEESKLAILRDRLLALRAKRVLPALDDKVLADWNGLMIAALAKAGVVFGEPGWIAMAERGFGFVASAMMVDSRLRHSWRLGQASQSATAGDYANMVTAALALHQATNRATYLERAKGWVVQLDALYWMSELGGYAVTADDAGDVLVRLCWARDDAVPSANTVMLTNLMHLFLLTGETDYRDRAETIRASFLGEVAAAPIQHAGFLANAMDVLAPQMIVIAERGVGDGEDLARAALALALPGALIYRMSADAQACVPIGLAGKSAGAEGPMAYVCLGAQCSAPIGEVGALVDALRVGRRASLPSSKPT